jgi:trimeric autotransporter adhesin
MPKNWISLFMAFSSTMLAQNVITTIAGLDPVFNGDGAPATSVPIGYVNGVTTDRAGNIYFTDPLEHLVLRVSTTGILSVIAGNGVAAYSGDGGPATSAGIASADSPDQYVGRIFEDGLGGIAVDGSGNVYFADGHYLRRIATDGTITTVAGGGTKTPGDGLAATQASLGIVNGVALDSAGNLYFAEANRIRKVTPGGTISTYAGSDTNGFSGDGGPAMAALLSQPLGIAFDAQGNLFVADGDAVNFPSRIRRISSAGTITTFAGGGSAVPTDNAAPTSLNLTPTGSVTVDPSGAVYVFSSSNGYLLKFSGGRTTLLSTPAPGVFSDNVPARGAVIAGQRIDDNSGIAFDAAGNLYVADSSNGRLRKIDTQGFLTTVAGNGLYGFGGDAGPALGAYIQGPTALAQTPDGSIYFLDTLNERVRVISPAGIINTVYTNSLAQTGALNGIVSDPSGNVFVLLGRRIIELLPDGTMQVVLNQSGKLGDTGDGGPAAQATMLGAGGLTRDTVGNLYLSDPLAHRIRKITLDGKIQTIAGTGTAGLTADGFVALGSPITGPTTVLADNSGGLYFEESPTDPVGGAVIRYITPDGHLKTIAGNGLGGFTGDGGPGPMAGLMMQKKTGLALDKAGRLYIADSFNSRVRSVSPSGIINTFAGDGQDMNAGDGGVARNASLFTPRGLLFDSKGDLLISDVSANRIRAILAALPADSVTPSAMNFSGKAGGAQAPPQKLTFTSPVSGLSFSATRSSDADWLTLANNAKAGGFAPRIINVRADPSNLTQGTYKATITVTSNLGVPTATNIPVTFVVGPGDSPKLSVDRPSLSFTFPSNPTTTKSLAVRVSNQGTGSLAFTAKAQTATGGNWLSVNLASGNATPQTPVHLMVTAKPTGLGGGTYTGSVIISSSTTGESFTVLVTLTVSTLDQAIQLSQAALSFEAVATGGVVPVRTFAISNIGRGNMPFTVSTRTITGGTWLAANPKSGVAIANSTSPRITVSVNQTGLAPGFYYGLVAVESSGSANTPQVVTVALHVLPATQDPGPVVEPSEVFFTAVQGDPSPGAKTLLVYNVSATPQTFVSSVVSDSNNQFSFIPQNSTLSLTQPGRIVIQPLTANLAAGLYEAELTLQFSDGTIRRIELHTIVTPAAATSSKNATDIGKKDLAAGCNPTQLVPALTSLGQAFGVPAAWPVSLEADVRDDCGNALNSGSVRVSFSNGDPPLGMQFVDSGSWTVTWASGNNSGPVTVTVLAEDPSRNLFGTRDVTGGLGDSATPAQISAAESGASFAPNTPLAPNSIISLFGKSLANGTSSAQSLPLSTTLSGATVIMTGNAMPLIYASDGQINAVVPSKINVNTSHQILIQRDSTLSIPIRVDVAPAEPAIFPYPLPGDPPTQGAIVNAVTYAVADPSNPVTAGDILAIFCTGLGAVDKQIADGTGAPSSPLANTTAVPTVTIGGKPASVAFSGLSPGYVGLYQIDVTVPSGVAPGQVPVVLSIDGQTGPAATITVK